MNTYKTFLKLSPCLFVFYNKNIICDCEYDKDKMHYYMYKTMTGKEFKQIFPNFKPTKIVGNNNNNFKYVIGKNTDTKIFDSKDINNSNGLYFCDSDDIPKKFNSIGYSAYGDYIAMIELYDDELICISNECRTHSFEIKDITGIREFINKLDKRDLLLYIKTQSCFLKYLDEQTEDICKLAIDRNSDAYYYIKCDNRTYNIKKYALSKDGLLLEAMPNQNEELCKIAVEQNGLSLKFVEDKTFEICELAYKQNKESLKYVENFDFKLRLFLFY